MTRYAAGITISLDGYITGPNDGPGRGLGDSSVCIVVGGRPHYEAAQGWGGPNPFGVPFFMVVHRPRTLPQTPGSGS